VRYETIPCDHQRDYRQYPGTEPPERAARSHAEDKRVDTEERCGEAQQQLRNRTLGNFKYPDRLAVDEGVVEDPARIGRTKVMEGIEKCSEAGKIFRDGCGIDGIKARRYLSVRSLGQGA
jgi:hypothetical protein